MAFRSVNFAHLAKFNSANSSDFIDMYEKFVDDKIIAENSEPKHKTFAPSSFRCRRVSWFRLRGVQPDPITHPDKVLPFTAQLGTACHQEIQSNLSEALKADWISVKEYLDAHPPQYTYTIETSGYETLIDIPDPPTRFACDGIVLWKGQYYLLEIKTSEFSSFDELTNPKDQHIDQIKCYATLLGLTHVLVVYQDRQYGGLKCYEMTITDSEKHEIQDTFTYVQDMVEACIAPEKLPAGDPWCTPAHCPYYKTCKEW